MPIPFRCALTIRSDTAYLAVLRAFVDSVAHLSEHRGFTKRMAIVCKMALVEAVDNAIIHAHKRKVDLPLRVSFCVERERVVMEVVDSGGGVDGLCIVEPEVLASHGRGLFLIRRCMTRVESRVRNGRHILRMILRL